MSRENINSRTLLTGLIGYPLEHSLSPLLHNSAFRQQGLNYAYLPLKVRPADLKSGLEGIRALNFRGINVTIPHKEEVLPWLDEVDPLVEEIGAVNTIVNQAGWLKGYNTDAAGFQRMLREEGGFEIDGKRAVVTGAGGASRAVGIALCRSGISRIDLLNRTVERAEELAASWQRFYPGATVTAGPLEVDYCRPLIQQADLLVDTTPVGMSPANDVEPVVPSSLLHEHLLVVDLVYNPLQTSLLRAAEEAGAATLNGLGMLLYQGAEAFQLWTGSQPDIELWRRLAESALKEEL